MTKIIHVKVTDGSEQDIRTITEYLKDLTSKNSLDYEFIITNEKIEVQDIKHLIKYLYELYKKDKGDKNE